MSSSPIPSTHDLICPITLDVYRDPVLAGDGHIYERKAIMKWIEEQGTSPLTREPLNIEDLQTDEHVQQLCQSYRSNMGTYSSQSSVISLPSVSQTDTENEQQLYSTTKCNAKQSFLIIIVLILIFSPFIISTSIIFCLSRYDSSYSSISITTKRPSAVYTISNSDTLPTRIILFSLNSVQRFESTFFLKVYTAVSTETILTFAFQHNTSYWCLNNVSFFDLFSKEELIRNENFEKNPSNGYFRCSTNETQSFRAGSIHSPVYLRQKLHTKIGGIYRISFWLQNTGNAPNSAKVIINSYSYENKLQTNSFESVI